VDGKKETHKIVLADHRAAISSILDLLPKGTIENIASVGHRVVHGGENFNKAAKIDDEVMGAIKKASPLAPLHNPWHILGIEVARRSSANIPRRWQSSTRPSIKPCPHMHTCTRCHTKCTQNTRYGSMASTGLPTST
jgi:hypothetical protein